MKSYHGGVHAGKDKAHDNKHEACVRAMDLTEIHVVLLVESKGLFRRLATLCLPERHGSTQRPAIYRLADVPMSMEQSRQRPMPHPQPKPILALRAYSVGNVAMY